MESGQLCVCVCVVVNCRLVKRKRKRRKRIKVARTGYALSWSAPLFLGLSVGPSNQGKPRKKTPRHTAASILFLPEAVVLSAPPLVFRLRGSSKQKKRDKRRQRLVRGHDKRATTKRVGGGVPQSDTSRPTAVRLVLFRPFFSCKSFFLMRCCSLFLSAFFLFPRRALACLVPFSPVSASNPLCRYPARCCLCVLSSRSPLATKKREKYLARVSWAMLSCCQAITAPRCKTAARPRGLPTCLSLLLAYAVAAA